MHTFAQVKARAQEGRKKLIDAICQAVAFNWPIRLNRLATYLNHNFEPRASRLEDTDMEDVYALAETLYNDADAQVDNVTDLET